MAVAAAPASVTPLPQRSRNLAFRGHMASWLTRAPRVLAARCGTCLSSVHCDGRRSMRGLPEGWARCFDYLPPVRLERPHDGGRSATHHPGPQSTPDDVDMCGQAEPKDSGYTAPDRLRRLPRGPRRLVQDSLYWREK